MKADNKKPPEMLKKIIEILDLTSAQVSPLQSYERLDPFKFIDSDAYFIDNTISDAVIKLINYKITLLNILKEHPIIDYKNDPRDEGVFEFKIGEVVYYEKVAPFNPPGKFPLKTRLACDNGVPSMDRGMDELFFILIRILEAVVLAPEYSYEFFDRLISNYNIKNAFEMLDRDFFQKALLQASPESMKSFFPNFNLNVLDEKGLEMCLEDKNAKDWGRVLLRVMIVAYTFDKKLLSTPMSNEAFSNLLIENGLQDKTLKIYAAKIVECRASLNISRK